MAMTVSAARLSAGPGVFRYVLAFMGGHVAFVPLLVLLLPRRVEAGDAADPVAALSILLVIGGVVASIANIVAGRLSDRAFAQVGSRRGMITLGLALVCASYAPFALSSGFAALCAAIIAFQVAVNVLLAPLGALLADYVEDARKGRVAGLLSAALPLSYGVLAVLGWAFPRDADLAFAATAVITAVLVLPLLLAWPFGRGSAGDPPALAAPIGAGAGRDRRSVPRDFAMAFVARLAMQCGAVLVLSYVFFYLEGLAARIGPPPGGTTTAALALLSVLALCASALASVVAGLASDRLGQRRGPLMACCALAAAALALMAGAPGWWAIFLSYPLFNAGLSGFVALDAALVGQLVAGDTRRGFWLGIMNLTNTVPAIAVPLLTLLYAAGDAMAVFFPAFLASAACAAIIAIACVAAIRSID
ncbi:MFS transporter [uncultured Croceicoccus sp.]|uniref:MFS transporter n=1 Tax=uncultured Croceicoccus sp. TaxID=1295329 RepID=UPI00261BB30D|nr:MFS transporter [uncultured Croceicoccus sp.]